MPSYVHKAADTARAAETYHSRDKKYFKRRVAQKDISLMCRQFSTMLDSGLGITHTMDALIAETSNSQLRRILDQVYIDIKAGVSLSRAFAAHPNIFSNLFVGMIRAGEATGQLSETTQRLSTLLEKDEAMRRKLKSAAHQPMLVTAASLFVTAALNVLVVPQMMKISADMGIKDFPEVTLIVHAISDFLIYRWDMILVGSMALFAAYKALTATDFGSDFCDRLALKAPIFGKLNQKTSMAQFSRTLYTLLISGVPILYALETAAQTVSNGAISAAILQARVRVRQGETIADSLLWTNLFPPTITSMIAVGEETGQLDTILKKLADTYEAEVDSLVYRLAAALEPALMIVVGLIVLITVMAIFMPMMPACSCMCGCN